MVLGRSEVRKNFSDEGCIVQCMQIQNKVSIVLMRNKLDSACGFLSFLHPGSESRRLTFCSAAVMLGIENKLYFL